MMKKAIVIFLQITVIILYGCRKHQDGSNNPLLESFETSYGVPPFQQIKAKHFMQALEAAIHEQEAEIVSIVNNTSEPSFLNTLVALDRSGNTLRNVQSIFSGLKSAHATRELQEIAGDFNQRITEHFDNIYMNYNLFKRIETVDSCKDIMNYTTEQLSLIEFHYKRFIRNGVNLPEDKKFELREINQRLAELSVQFDQNLLAETNNFRLILDSISQLAGLPEDVIKTAAATANQMNLEGKWVFTVHKPSMIPFLQYSKHADLRKKIYDAYINRCNNNNEFDNKALVIEITNLRMRKAQLLGFHSYADYELDDRMAENPERVTAFLDQIWEAAGKAAIKERSEMQEIMDREGGNASLNASDWWYYAEKLKNNTYHFNENELRPYLELNHVLEGIFIVSNKLYGIVFKKIEGDFPRPHPDAIVFEVTDSDSTHLGILYMDFYTRPTKNQGAWCGIYRKQYKLQGANVRPVVTIVCNFSNPTMDQPVLLTLDEAVTMFHEFGHGLHQFFSDVTYQSISGTSVKRDFVELPSQIMENWAIEPEVMKLYAKHYQTNEPIPNELIDKLSASRYFNQGFATVEYVAASLLDLKYHLQIEPLKTDIETFENTYLKSIGLIPEIISRYRSTYFKHIWSDGYQAGYYSYLWAEVLDKDAYELFRKSGILNRETAKAFREIILEKGGSDDPMELFIRFNGQGPDIEPMLRDRGLL